MLLRPLAVAIAVGACVSGAAAQLSEPPLLMPSWRADGDQTTGPYGMGMASAGDVNGDGFDDVIVGAPDYDHGQADEGAAWVYLGSAEGLSPSPAWMAESDQSLARFARTVAGPGDVNGDGYDDVLVTASHWSGAWANEGAAFVWLGGPGGLGANGTPANADWSVTGGGTGVQLSAAALADVNGDGFEDAILGTGHFSGEFPNDIIFQGIVRVYRGSALGLPAVPDEEVFGGQEEAFYGALIERAGDVNADGFDDVLITKNGFASFPFTHEGWVVCEYGAPGGLYASGGWSAHAGQQNAAFGAALGCAGDLNADGFDDVFVCAPDYVTSPTTKGGVFVYYGGASGLGGLATPLDADWSAIGNQYSGNFGRAAAGVGDLSGDGYDDFAVGAFAYGSSFEGQLFVWNGGPGGPAQVTGQPGNVDALFECNQPAAWLGAAVAPAGDVNSDGHGDTLVLARLYDGAAPDGGRMFALHGGNPWVDLQSALAGASGTPSLLGVGSLQPSSAFELSVEGAAPGAPLVLVVGVSVLGANFKGGIMVPDPGPPGLLLALATGAGGGLQLNATWPAALPPGLTLVMQGWIVDAGGPAGYAATNGALATVP